MTQIHLNLLPQKLARTKSPIQDSTSFFDAMQILKECIN
jgi:hypothetical protein